MVVALVTFTVLYFASRLWIIEGDLAPYQLTNIQKLDAPYYVMAAFEWLHGKYEPGPISDSVSVIPNGLFYNAIVYLNLLILGNDYYGFRFNVVVVSWMSAIIFSYLFYRRFGLSSLLVALPTFLLAFPWFMASLEVEPTVYRIFHVALLCGMFAVLGLRRGGYDTLSARFLVFLAAFFGPLFVYPTNLFVVFAVYAFYLIRGWQLRQVRYVAVTALISGGALLVSAAAWLAVTIFAFGNLSTVLNFFSLFTERVSSTDRTIWDDIFRKFIDIRIFGLFSETPAVFYLYIVSLFAMVAALATALVKRQPTRSDPDLHFRVWFDLLMPLLSLALFFQTLFVNDYPLKKLTILIPFVIAGALYVFEFVKVPLPVCCAVFSIYMVWPSAVLSYKYLYEGYTENYKKAMVALRDIGAAGVAGGFSHSFRLYNSIQPYASAYVYMHVLHNMNDYHDILAGRIDGVRPKYSIQIEVDAKTIDAMRRLGFRLNRMLIETSEQGVGSVALFERVE